MRKLLRKGGYQEVKTPLILSEQLWHTSGHYDNYMENMFFTKLKLRDPSNAEKINDNVEEDRPMAVKPMNCPGHLMVYKTRLHSHNEFPLRIAEMGLSIAESSPVFVMDSFECSHLHRTMLTIFALLIRLSMRSKCSSRSSKRFMVHSI